MSKLLDHIYLSKLLWHKVSVQSKAHFASWYAGLLMHLEIIKNDILFAYIFFA